MKIAPPRFAAAGIYTPWEKTTVVLYEDYQTANKFPELGFVDNNQLRHNGLVLGHSNQLAQLSTQLAQNVKVTLERRKWVLQTPPEPALLETIRQTLLKILRPDSESDLQVVPSKAAQREESVIPRIGVADPGGFDRERQKIIETVEQAEPEVEVGDAGDVKVVFNLLTPAGA